MVKYLLTYSFIFCLQILFAQDYNYTISKVNVHGDFEIYSPVYYYNKIVVCSNKKDEVFCTILDASNKAPINLHIIENYKKDSLILKPFDKTFRTKLNDGPITFNKNYTHCFISQNYDNLKKENNNLQLIEYIKKGDVWEQTSAFKFNNNFYSLTHPTLNNEGNVLIFSSNMPGGYGGFDLWKSVKINGSWSKPVNLGSNVNSANNEYFPSFVNDELYFSSNRGGYGGLDIYKANISLNHPPTLLPKPINSGFDDFSLIATSNSGLEEGYFSSNRDGKDRIYKFSYDFPEFNNCDSIVENNFCYTLYEESAVAIPNQEALIYKWTINGEKKRGPEIRYCFPGPGNYEIILDVEDTIAHIKYDKQSHLNITLDNVIKPYISSVDTVHVNTEFYLSATESYLPYMQNKKYFWSIENKKMIGEQTSYAFKQTGKYQVQLGVVGYEDTIKVTDCVYKTIVCVDNNVFESLTNDYYALKEQIGDAYLISNNQIKTNQIGETFTLTTFNYKDKNISISEKKELEYVARYLKKHPNVIISLTYYIDPNQPNDILKEKVTNIVKYLILYGIENNRISMVEKTTVLNEKPNIIEFNFKIYENN